MFKVAKNQTFARKVSVKTPVDGGFLPETLTCIYRLLTTDQMREVDLSTADGTRRFLVAVIDRIDDLADDNEQPLPYSDAVRDYLISLLHVRRALVDAYLDAVAHDVKSGN